MGKIRIGKGSAASKPAVEPIVTVTRDVLEVPVVQEVFIEKPVEIVIEKIIEVPVEKIVEREIVVEKEVIVEKIITVPEIKEVVREVEVIVEIPVAVEDISRIRECEIKIASLKRQLRLSVAVALILTVVIGVLV